MKARVFLLLLVSLLAEAAVAQPLCQVVRYDEKDGVPSSHVVQLLQDDQGFMWFAAMTDMSFRPSNPRLATGVT